MEHNPREQSLLSDGHRLNTLSSNSTLFWRIFIPAFGTVFLSGFVLVFWLINEDDLYLSYSALWPRLVITVIWAGWLFFLWRTLLRLKRIDADNAYLYVTNYWTTARYPWQDVAKVVERRQLGRTFMTFYLKAPGVFGERLSFLPATRFYDWMKLHKPLLLVSA